MMKNKLCSFFVLVHFSCFNCWQFSINYWLTKKQVSSKKQDPQLCAQCYVWTKSWCHALICLYFKCWIRNTKIKNLKLNVINSWKQKMTQTRSVSSLYFLRLTLKLSLIIRTVFLKNWYAVTTFWCPFLYEWNKSTPIWIVFINTSKYKRSLLNSCHSYDTSLLWE